MPDKHVSAPNTQGRQAMDRGMRRVQATETGPG